MISYARSLLMDAGIESVEFDSHTANMEGSVSAIPCRLMVIDADVDRARRVPHRDLQQPDVHQHRGHPHRPTRHRHRATGRHHRPVAEPDFGPPTTRYPFGALLPGFANTPRLLCDGIDFPALHPILTTDFFEFGTSTNHLGDQGCGVEGDAVLGLVAGQIGAGAPRWLVVRNASDPPINGALPTSPSVPDMQAHWALFYYEQYGYWTSVNSALACWALIAADH